MCDIFKKVVGADIGAVLLAAFPPVPAYADDVDGNDLTVTTSGLAWKDVSEGTGSVPVAGSTIRFSDPRTIFIMD